MLRGHRNPDEGVVVPALTNAPKASKNKRPLSDSIQEARDWWLQFERCLAGYDHLSKALASFTAETTGQPVQDQERRKGLPLFTFPASADGRTKIDVVANLADVDPQYVPHVLIPLINMFRARMTEALEEVMLRVEELQKLLVPPQAAPADVFMPPGGEEAE